MFIPGAILSCIVVATHEFSSHNCVNGKVNKQVEENSKVDQGSKNKKAGKCGNTLKVVMQGRSPMPANILVDI